MSEKHWLKKLRDDHAHLKQVFAMQALSNYIVLTMSDYEIERLIPLLNDPTKTTRVEIYVVDREALKGKG